MWTVSRTISIQMSTKIWFISSIPSSIIIIISPTVITTLCKFRSLKISICRTFSIIIISHSVTNPFNCFSRFWEWWITCCRRYSTIIWLSWNRSSSSIYLICPWRSIILTESWRYSPSFFSMGICHRSRSR